MMFPRALFVGASLCLVPMIGQAQIKTTLRPATATQLQASEIIRYYKVRPGEKIDGVPYQVLIVVTKDSYRVTTNKWEFTEKLNEAQKDDLIDTLGYQSAADFRRLYRAPTEPRDLSSELTYYLSFRRKGQTISWNSRKYGQPRLPSLFDFLEVVHYLARKAKEAEQN